MDARYQDEDDSRRYIPTPQSPILSDYQLGRRDVEEQQEKDRELGIPVQEDENPFYPDRKNDFEYIPFGESPEGPYVKDLQALEAAVSDYVEAEEGPARSHATGEILRISNKLIAQKEFVTSDSFQEYNKIKEPYLKISLREASKKKESRDEEELRRLRGFLNS